MDRKVAEAYLDIIGTPEVYTKADALLYMQAYSKDGEIKPSIRVMARDFSWSNSKVVRFISFLINNGILLKQDKKIKFVLMTSSETKIGTKTSTKTETLESNLNGCKSYELQSSNKQKTSTETSTESGTETSTQKGKDQDISSSPLTLLSIEKEKEKEENKNNKLFSRKKTEKTSPLADKVKACDQRDEEFYNELIPFLGIYGKEMIREFYDYWSERNVSKTKMRKESQPTWELSKRLATWNKKNESKRWKGTY